MNEEVKKKNRAWVKDAAIIFLAVMLVLTFFSNTILNWSLPEVSGQYAGYGQIRSSVSGSGTVKSNLSYSVSVKEPRVIDMVLVGVGDYVTEGQPLFTLEEYENDELTQAQSALDDLEYNYQMKILDRASPDYLETELRIEEYYEQLEQLRSDLSEAEKSDELIKGSEELVKIYQNETDKYTQSVSTLEEEVAQLTNGEAANSEEIAQKLELVEAAQKELDDATDVMNEKKEAQDEISGGMETSYSAALSAYQAAERSYSSANTELTYQQQDYNALVSANANYTRAKNRVTSAQTALDQAKSRYDAASAALTSARTAAQAAYSGSIDSDSEYERLVSEQQAYDAALRAYQAALEGGDPEQIESAKNALDALTDHSAALSALELYRAAKSDASAAEAANADAQQAYDEADRALKELTAVSDSELSSAKRALDRQRQSVAELQRALSDARSTLDEASRSDTLLQAAKREYDTAASTVKEKTKALEALQKELDTLLSEETKRARASLKSEQAKLKAVNAKAAEEEKKLSELQSKLTSTPDAIEKEIESLEKTIKTEENNAQKQREQDAKNDSRFQLELKRDEEQIEKQRALVEKLSEKTYDAQILSKHTGYISAINTWSGAEVTPNEQLMTIELEDSGYTMELTLTAEQCRQIGIGDKATVDNWWGRDLDITVTAIKNDRTNPNSGNMIVELTIKGNVSDGQTLDVSIGERRTSYELVVPNSAIREDADGKYILIASVKSTPLGNRYKAKRVNVTVVAKDTINSAVETADPYNYEYVISSATAPIEDGTLVRLVES